MNCHQYDDAVVLFDTTVTYKTIFGMTREWNGRVPARRSDVHEVAVETAKRERRGLGAISEVCGSVAVESMWKD